MNTAVVQHQSTVLKTISEGVDEKAVIAQVKAIQQIMKTVMVEGVHYGTIPGCNQPSLYKSGSETLLSAFKISVEPEVETIRDGDHITVKVIAYGRHMASGIIVGAGVGECSTAEDKYAWRAAVCDEEFTATPETHKRVKWGHKKAWNDQPEKTWSVNQVRTNPADLANTILKMAKKRAQIDLCLTALAASDCFTQDLEDLPEEYTAGMQGRAPAEGTKKPQNKYQPKEKSGEAAAPGACSTAQVGLLRSRLKASNIEESALLAQYQLGKLEEMPKGKVNEALDWIAKGGTAAAAQ